MQLRHNAAEFRRLFYVFLQLHYVNSSTDRLPKLTRTHQPNSASVIEMYTTYVAVLYPTLLYI